MKKLFCIVLALAMMLSFGSMAAAETTAEAVKGTTLFNCDENGIPDLGGVTLKIWLPMDSDYASFASSYNDFAIVKEMEKLMNVNLEFICPSADDVAKRTVRYITFIGATRFRNCRRGCTTARLTGGRGWWSISRPTRQNARGNTGIMSAPPMG